MSGLDAKPFWLGMSFLAAAFGAVPKELSDQK
jgi:hypothetical protein